MLISLRLYSRQAQFEAQLSTVIRHRSRYRERRKKNGVLQIALVGYTNAGKSTWFNRGKLCVDFMNAISDMAAVGFQFRFPGTSCPNPSALPGEIDPLSRQTRQCILQLSQFYLKFAFSRSCPLCENI